MTTISQQIADSGLTNKPRSLPASKATKTEQVVTYNSFSNNEWRIILYTNILILLPTICAILVNIYNLDRMDVFAWLIPLVITGAIIDQFILKNPSNNIHA